MFNLFKRRKIDNYLKDWSIPISSDFVSIFNGDSVQFFTENESKIVYLSLLKIDPILSSSDQVFSDEVTISYENDYFNLKGFKHSNGEILTCLISFKEKNQESWARNFFSQIKNK